MMWSVRALILCGLAACSDGPSGSWHSVLSDQPTALLSVWSASPRDVYVVGGDARDGKGPVALHYDGAAWQRLDTGIKNIDLWWTFGFTDGTVFMGGSGGTILRSKQGTVTAMPTPGLQTSVVVFGIWGAASNDVWAVGGLAGGAGGGFVWHYDGTAWTARNDVPGDRTVFKVTGRSTSDVWMVGSAGLGLHWNGSSLDRSDVGTDGSLLSVAGMDDRFVAVGGNFDGILYENADGDGSWKSALSQGGPLLNGVAASGSTAYAVGHGGTVLGRGSSGWKVENTSGATTQNLHAITIDSAGGVWVVGGNFDDAPTTRGVLIYRGTEMIGGTIQ
jgi:hypothetical protein